MKGGKCLICNGNLPSSSKSLSSHANLTDKVNFVDENKRASTSSLSSSLINQHVHTIFILKTVFQLTSIRLTNYLKNCPNIEKWITLCSNCEQIINDCKLIYNDLLKIQRRLLASRLNIVNLVRANYNCGSVGDDDDQFNEKDQQFNISQDCRRFIINRKYTEIQDNPFINGDNQALDKLVDQLSSAVERDEEEEEPFVEIKIEEDDDDPLSQIPEEIVLPHYPHEDDDRISQTGPISQQIPLTNEDDDWQPQQDSPSDSDSPSSSDSGNSLAPSKIKSKRQKVIQSKRKSGPKCQCSICNKILSSPWELRRHLGLVHNIADAIKTYPCDIPNCSRKFEDIHKLSRHKISAHHVKIVFKCRRQHCQQEFLSKRSRNKHEDEDPHTSDPIPIPFSCYLCPSTFSSKADLTTHKVEIHNLRQRHYRPLNCSSKSPSKHSFTWTPSKYQCSICRQILSGPLTHLHHVALHHNVGFQKRYPCNVPFCSKVFPNSHKLSLHKSTKHDKLALHKCRHCGKGFSNLKSRKTHENLHKSNPSYFPFSCNRCPDGFPSESALILHKAAVHSRLPQPEASPLDLHSCDPQYHCTKCPSKYPLQTSLLLHISQVHSQKRKRNRSTNPRAPKPTPHHCPLCPSKFTLVKSLNRHIVTLHDIEPTSLSTSSTNSSPVPKETPHHCTLCPFKFHLLLNLHRHLQSIHNQKGTPPKKAPRPVPQRCPYCPCKFTYLPNFNRHLQSVHNQEPEKSYECTLCPRKFATHGDLRKHCRMQHKVELELPPDIPVICETCGNTFKNKYTMRSHQKNSPKCRPFHCKDKPLKPDISAICELCGGKFANKYSMLDHIRRVHEKKKNFICEKCPPGKGFDKEAHYKYHLFSEHGEGKVEDVMKWLCPEKDCGKRWRTERELKWHLDMHKGTKSFKCEECGKAFYQPIYLRKHKSNVHNWKGEKWKCELCEKEFKTKRNLKFHVDEIHLQIVRKKVTKNKKV